MSNGTDFDRQAVVAGVAEGVVVGHIACPDVDCPGQVPVRPHAFSAKCDVCGVGVLFGGVDVSATLAHES